MRLLILMLTSILFLLGCQTPPHKYFENVKTGMTKDEVLEVAGNPTTTRRMSGKDRWIYDFPFSPAGPMKREVHFENGKAVYVGAPIAPLRKADEQDRLNDAGKLDSATVGLKPEPQAPVLTPAQDALFKESVYGIPANTPTPTPKKFEEINGN